MLHFKNVKGHFYKHSAFQNAFSGDFNVRINSELLTINFVTPAHTIEQLAS